MGAVGRLAGMLLVAAPASAEWIAAGYLGAARTLESSIHIVQPSLGTDFRLRGVQFGGRSLESPVYYGYRLAYFPWRHVGMEGEFIHLKIYAEIDRTIRTEGVRSGETFETSVPMRAVAQQFSVSHGLNLLLANLVLRQDLARRVTAAIRLGAGGTIPHPETEIFGLRREDYQRGRLAVHAAGGVEIRFWRGGHWLAEYKYTWTDQRFDVHSGRASLIVQSHHIATGVAWRF